jgi:Malectin domain/PQQ-like domain
MLKLLGTFLLTSAAVLAQISVTTHHYDNARTGGNTSEHLLNTATVNPAQFGKLFSYPVDGHVYAQPLYLPAVTLADGSTHNVVYIVTMNNSVYAFDADSNTSTNASPLWTVNYNNPAAGITPIPSTDVQSPNVTDIIGPIGIEGTPVIDTANAAMYFVVQTKENGAYFQRLHAINIRSGAELANSAVVIGGSVSGAKGSLKFDPKVQNQRAALALANGMVYIAWGSHTDLGAFHGWVMSFSTYSSARSGSTIQPGAVFCTTYGASGGGIWQSGSGPVIDANGNLYYGSGNGSWDGITSFSQSTLKLSPSLQLLDYFTPDNWLNLDYVDDDLGVGGVLALPGTNLLVEPSKTGLLYLQSTDGLGHLLSGNTQIPQVLSAATGHIHSGPTYWNSPTYGPLVYIWSENDKLKAYHFNGVTFDTTAVLSSTFKDPPGMPGGFFSVSSNGATPGSGVLWVNVPYTGDANHATVPGVLRAFDADNLAVELWDSRINAARDDFGNFGKFVPPVVANGKVYMATFSNQVAVYGLLPVITGITESLSTPALTLNPWATGTFAVNVAGTGILPGPITLSVTGVPSGLTVQFDTNSIVGSGTANVTLSTGTGTAPGSYTFNIVAQSGVYTNTQQFTLTIGNDLPTGIRINAGGVAAGAFLSDVDYVGGSTSSVAKAVITTGVNNPAPQSVYQSDRFGKATYTIPNLNPGQQYVVRLHFAETYFNTTGARIFNVAINGTTVLQNFDIVATAGTSFTAVVKEFQVVANNSGQITVALTNGTANNAKINGIEVLPAKTGVTERLSATALSLGPGANGSIAVNVTSTGTLPGLIALSASGVPNGVTLQFDHASIVGSDTANATLINNSGTPGSYVVTVMAQSGTYSNSQQFTLTLGASYSAGIQINAGGAAVGSFLSDVDYLGGSTSSVAKAIITSGVINPAPQAVYQSDRFQPMTYTIPNLKPGQQYLVRLHFSENYFTTLGARLFNVAINGTAALQNFDILAAAGAPFTAVVEEFHTTASSTGQIVIAFTKGSANYPKISGIEVQ